MEGRAAAALLLVLALMGAVTAGKGLDKRKPCGPVCLMYCPNGNVLDENGCPICKCREEGGLDKRQSCGPVCAMYCPNGNVLDENGCPLCKCREENVCKLPSDTGRCKAKLPRYFYNYHNGRCEQFDYGGCGGNGNRFATEEECWNTCHEDVCRLPQEPGRCMAYFPKYFFNSATGTCEQFVYGGCGGNGNRFETIKDCENKCLRH